MEQTNRSELRKKIMTILYQINIYEQNKIEYDVEKVIKEVSEIENEFIKDTVYGVITYKNEIDEFFNKVDVCHHYHESAGENVWNFFEVEDYIVGQSVFLNKRKEFCDELLKLKQEDVKKLVK